MAKSRQHGFEVTADTNSGYRKEEQSCRAEEPDWQTCCWSKSRNRVPRFGGTERRDSGHMTNVTPEPQEEVTSEDGKGAFATAVQQSAAPATEGNAENLEETSPADESRPTSGLKTDGCDLDLSTEPSSDQIAKPTETLWARLVRVTNHQLVGGVVAGAIVGVAVFGAQNISDRRQSYEEQKAGRELTWRQIIVTDANATGADIRDLDLPSLYAPRVNLSLAAASGADLTGGMFQGSFLDAADLSGAVLDNAKFQDSSFVAATLVGTSFVGADLQNVDFRSADMRRSDLTEADIWKADFRGVDLSDTTLPVVALGQTCWDANTVWPDAATKPETALCSTEERPMSPSTSYATETLVKIHGDDSKTWQKELNVSDEDVISVLVTMENRGLVPTNAVSILVDLGTDNDPLLLVEPGSIKLYNGNYPEGYVFSDDAIQAAGSQVNIKIGNYSGGIDGYVTLRLRVDADDPRLKCGIHDLRVIAYVTPDGRGTLNDNASVIYDTGRPPC